MPKWATPVHVFDISFFYRPQSQALPHSYCHPAVTCLPKTTAASKVTSHFKRPWFRDFDPYRGEFRGHQVLSHFYHILIFIIYEADNSCVFIGYGEKSLLYVGIYLRYRVFLGLFGSYFPLWPSVAHNVAAAVPSVAVGFELRYDLLLNYLMTFFMGWKGL